ncbi:response regulator [Gorillibacterium massiliense]|uniref:response regulator n=1 Tax=Gorillibacterium massiliense TaxID=1280390 RepID=UPI0004AFE562|nr:response regulator [Gorillibacterium massiliense]
MSVSILLVDDEAIDLEWLRRRVVGSKENLRVVGTANSGFAALKIIEQERIDIILSDIRMPIMSGIDFARKAREINPDVNIVFISGHEDFQYAKEAISLRAFNYLLKPVDDTELSQMLSALVRKVENERESERSFSEALSLVHEELLLRWFKDSTPGPVEAHVRQYLEPKLTDGCTIALAELDDFEWRIEEYSPLERKNMAKQVADVIGAFMEETGFGQFVESPPARFLLLATVPTEWVEGMIEQLLEKIRKTLPWTMTIGTGRAAYDLEQLHESFRQAQAALSAKWLLGKNRLICDASTFSPTGSAPSDVDDKVDGLLKAILEYDLVAIDDRLMELFGASKGLSQNDVYNLIIRIISKLHGDLLQMKENLYELLKWESHQPDMLFRFETVHDVLSWLRKRFFELSELLYTKRRKMKRKLIENIMAFVEDKLDQKITLKEVAAHFEFTPNYLGFLFKEETGEHFSDYLNARKMERICRLLTDPAKKIYEIADLAGYKNIIYFNRQFKQSMGMTPGEYRKRYKI